MNLAEIKEAAKGVAEVERSAEVDISEALGLPEKKAVITLRELDAPRLFLVEDDAKAVRRRRPQWPPSLCQAVALLGMAHVSPKDPQTTPMDFYVELAEHNKTLYLRILKAYRKHFPVAGVAEDDEPKNDSGENEDS